MLPPEPGSGHEAAGISRCSGRCWQRLGRSLRARSSASSVRRIGVLTGGTAACSAVGGSAVGAFFDPR